MRTPVSPPQCLRTGPFRGSGATRLGLITKRQLEGRAWRRLLKDVYVHASVALTHRTRCEAVGLIMPPGTAISGTSAAYLFGADVRSPDAPVEVTVPRRMRMSSQPGLTVRYGDLRFGDATSAAGVPVTTPVRTAFDLARRCELDEAVVAVDALVQACGLRIDLISAYANDGRTGWHGVRRLAKVLEHVAAGAESPMETRLRLVLIRGGLPPPVLQHRVADASGAFVARLDLAYVECRLGIDYDGGCHWEPGAVRRDLRRQNALRALGWSLLRFTADDVLRNPSRVVEQVAAALGGRLP